MNSMKDIKWTDGQIQVAMCASVATIGNSVHGVAELLAERRRQQRIEAMVELQRATTLYDTNPVLTIKNTTTAANVFDEIMASLETAPEPVNLNGVCSKQKHGRYIPSKRPSKQFNKY